MSIPHTLSLCYVIYYIVLEICAGSRFLQESVYCYSQQFISAVANESLIPYNRMKRAPETQIL